MPIGFILKRRPGYCNDRQATAASARCVDWTREGVVEDFDPVFDGHRAARLKMREAADVGRDDQFWRTRLQVFKLA